MMTISISNFGSVPFPAPPSGTNQGGIDVFAFSPADRFAYAGTAYLNGSSAYITRLHKIDRLNNVVAWSVDIGTNASHYLTHAIVDPTGNFVYTSRRAGTDAFIEKRAVSDGSVVATSATSHNLGGAWNPGLLRIAVIGGVTYVALGGNTTGLFVVRGDTMATVLDIADVTGGLSPWFMQRMQFDASGNLFVGSFDSDMVRIAVPGGSTTVFQNVWPVDISVTNNADSMFWDSTDSTMVVGDENRTWRKIGNLSTTPSQVQVMESSDYPANLYQSEFTNLQNSANQEGFGASGTELQAVSGLGNQVTQVAYSYLLKHTDLTADVIIFGQNGQQGQPIAGPLFDPAGFWVVDASATDIQDVIADDTPTNPHATGLTFWTFQPTGTATKWQWFDITITTPPLVRQVINGGWQDPAGNPLAGGYLTFRLNSDMQNSSVQVCSGRVVTVPLDNSGNISGTVILSVNTPGSNYDIRAYTAKGQFVWRNPKFVLSAGGSPYDFSA